MLHFFNHLPLAWLEIYRRETTWPNKLESSNHDFCSLQICWHVLILFNLQGWSCWVEDQDFSRKFRTKSSHQTGARLSGIVPAIEWKVMLHLLLADSCILAWVCITYLLTVITSFHIWLVCLLLQYLNLMVNLIFFCFFCYIHLRIFSQVLTVIGLYCPMNLEFFTYLIT